MIVNSQDPRYQEVISEFEHYREAEIDAIVSESRDREAFASRIRDQDRNLGLNLTLMFTAWVRAELDALEKTQGKDQYANAVLLGETLALRRALRTFEDFITQGEYLYKSK